MFVLGIDPGLTRTGYAVLARRRGGTELLTLGVIRTAPGEPVPDRLVELHRDLHSVVSEFQPQVVAIEQVFVNRNLRTALSVARASGVAMMTAAAAGIPVVEYTPSKVKAAVAGYGNATKEQVQRMVTRRLGLAETPKPADAADALAVALCHLQTGGLAERLAARR